MRILSLIILSLMAQLSFAQRGSHANFHTSRVNYDWQYFETDHFVVYYDKGAKEGAKKIIDLANLRLRGIEERIGYRLSGKIEILFYRSLGDLNNSFQNEHSQMLDINEGGVTSVMKNTFSVYPGESKKELDYQIKKGIASVLVTEMLYGGTIQERVKYSTLLHLPIWFTEGLSEYLAAGWDEDADDRLRAGFEIDLYSNMNEIDAENAVLAGRSIWKFIDERRGDLTIPRILYLVRLTRKVESAIYFVFNWSTRDLFNEWESFYRGVYAADKRRMLPSGEEAIRHEFRSGKISSFRLSPDASKIAYVLYRDRQYSVVVYDRNYVPTENERSSSIPLLDQSERVVSWMESKVVYAYHRYDPHFFVIDWKNDDQLFVITHERNQVQLHELSATSRKRVAELDDIYNPSWLSFDGNQRLLIVGAGSSGQSIFAYDIETAKLSTVLSDSNDYIEPTFDSYGFGFYFTRVEFNANDTIGREWDSDVAYYRFADGTIEWIANDPKYDEFNAVHYGKSAISYLSTQNGISNSYLFDGNKVEGLTDYKHSILSQNVSRSENQVGELLRYHGEYHFFISEQVEEIEDLTTKVFADPTYYAARKFYKSLVAPEDTIQKEVNGIVGRKEVVFQTNFPNDDIDSILEVHSSLSKAKSAVKNKSYALQLVPIEVITQFHNGMLNTRRFAAYRSPQALFTNRFGAHVGAEISDIHRTRSFTGGIKVNSTFYRTELYANYTDRSKQLVKSFTAWRNSSVTSSSDFDFFKNLSNDYSIRWDRALNTRLNLYSGLGFRHDSRIRLSSESESLQSENQEQRFGRLNFGLEAGMITELGENLYQGWKVKALVEGQSGFGGSKSFSMLQLHAKYGKQIRPLLFGFAQLNANHSMGPGRAVFFMGGPENWVRPDIANTVYLSNKNTSYFVPVFGVRGFDYNARNGNTAITANFELRHNVGGLLFRRNGVSDFFKNLLFTGFFDMGSSWYGRSPYDRVNPMNTSTIETGGLRVVVVNVKNPLIYGMGVGARTTFFSYYIKADVAWGRDNGEWTGRREYITIGRDF